MIVAGERLGLPAQAHEARRAHGTVTHRKQRTGAHFLQRCLVQHLHLKAGAGAFLRGAQGKLFRAQVVGGHLHQGAREVHAVSRGRRGIHLGLITGGEQNDFLNRPSFLFLITAGPMGAVTGALGDEPGGCALGQQQGHRAALRLGGGAHGLTGRGKPMARHGVVAQTNQEEAADAAIRHAMNDGAFAGLGGKFAAACQFTEQPAKTGVQLGVHGCAFGGQHGQRVHLQFFPISRMDRDVHFKIYLSGPGSRVAMACSKSVAACWYSALSRSLSFVCLTSARSWAKSSGSPNFICT